MTPNHIKFKNRFKGKTFFTHGFRTWYQYVFKTPEEVKKNTVKKYYDKHVWDYKYKKPIFILSVITSFFTFISLTIEFYLLRQLILSQNSNRSGLGLVILAGVILLIILGILVAHNVDILNFIPYMRRLDEFEKETLEINLRSIYSLPSAIVYYSLGLLLCSVFTIVLGFLKFTVLLVLSIFIISIFFYFLPNSLRNKLSLNRWYIFQEHLKFLLYFKTWAEIYPIGLNTNLKRFLSPKIIDVMTLKYADSDPIEIPFDSGILQLINTFTDVKKIKLNSAHQFKPVVLHNDINLVFKFMGEDIDILSEKILRIDLQSKRMIPFELYQSLLLGSDKSKAKIHKELCEIIEKIDRIETQEISSIEIFQKFLGVVNLAKKSLHNPEYDQLDIHFEKTAGSKFKTLFSLKNIASLAGITSTIVGILLNLF